MDSHSVSFIMKVPELIILDFLELSILDMDVIFYHLVHSLQVGEGYLVVVLDQGLNLHRALPVNCLDVQAKVAIQEGWSSRHRRGAVKVYLIFSTCHQLVQCV